jgi:hypothetical protein
MYAFTITIVVCPRIINTVEHPSFVLVTLKRLSVKVGYVTFSLPFHRRFYRCNIMNEYVLFECV